jgi:hypothetical protein
VQLQRDLIFIVTALFSILVWFLLSGWWLFSLGSWISSESDDECINSNFVYPAESIYFCYLACCQLKINTYITQGPPPQAYGNHLHQPPPPGAYATEYNVAQMQAPQGNFAPIAPGPGGLASAISNGLAANGFNDSYSTIGQYEILIIIKNN